MPIEPEDSKRLAKVEAAVVELRAHIDDQVKILRADLNLSINNVAQSNVFHGEQIKRLADAQVAIKGTLESRIEKVDGYGTSLNEIKLQNKEARDQNIEIIKKLARQDGVIYVLGGLGVLALGGLGWLLNLLIVNIHWAKAFGGS